jgi:hypothetical protein
VNYTFTDKPRYKTQFFRDFAIGDVVVSRTSQIPGIKTGDKSIVFRDGGICYTVSPTEEYIMPRAVEVLVTL